MTEESEKRIHRQNPPVFVDEETGMFHFGCLWTPVFADEEDDNAD